MLCAQDHLSGLVLEDQALQHLLCNLQLIRIELAQRLELQAQSVVGSAFVLVEQQQIGADAECDGGRRNTSSVGWLVPFS
jgi:hypothetical protein